jgi:prophage regulatory protein
MTALPASKRTLRIWQVAKKLGLSGPTIWRLCASGAFPKPIKISKGCTVWLEHEIDELIDAKAAERQVIAPGMSGDKSAAHHD